MENLETKKEQWKSVVGYKYLYEVSDMGRVRRIGKKEGAVVGRILRPWKTSKGYLTVSVYDGHNHKTNKNIHRLVAKAFIGSPPVGKKEIRHLDGNPANNYVYNLAWGNGDENRADMVRHGRSSKPLNPLKGNAHHNHKIDDADIPRILQLLNTMTQKKIAEMFNVKQPTISAIKRGVIRRSNRTQAELDYYLKLKTNQINHHGENHPSNKLTEEDVNNIRKLLGTKTQKEIAQQFGVCQPTISAIKCGRLWGNVNG